MNYMYLMKKIIESTPIINDDILNIKQMLTENNLDVFEEAYEEEIQKYLNGKLKDLYC